MTDPRSSTARDALHAELTHALRAAAPEISCPAAVLLVESFERNVDLAGARVAAGAGGARRTLRPATKSVRCVDLLRRIQERGKTFCRGLMTFHALETAHLLARGFDDLLLAYPTGERAHLVPLAKAAAAHPEAQVRVVIDAPAQVEALASALAEERGARIGAVIDADASWRPLGGAIHGGVRRSPVRGAADALALARHAKARGIEVAGVMAYEAHLAGLPDVAAPEGAAEGPLAGLVGGARRGLLRLGVAGFKRQAGPAVRALRGAVVRALRAEGFALPLVNGGGTGSLEETAADPSVTEVTAGSLFFQPALFDRYAGPLGEPALLFACPVVRASDPGHVTVLGGGWIASGASGEDRAPTPWLPAGLALTGAEGAGEVQTPLLLPKSGRGKDLRPGDLVFFRHAKAGEACERVNALHLVRGGTLEGAATTYRGEGWAFL